MNGKDLLKLLQKNGWILVRITGSHHYMRKGKTVVSVPVHSARDIDKGLLLKILSTAGLR